jgi:hypothetical protein
LDQLVDLVGELGLERRFLWVGDPNILEDITASDRDGNSLALVAVRHFLLFSLASDLLPMKLLGPAQPCFDQVDVVPARCDATSGLFLKAVQGIDCFGEAHRVDNPAGNAVESSTSSRTPAPWYPVRGFASGDLPPKLDFGRSGG